MLFVAGLEDTSSPSSDDSSPSSLSTSGAKFDLLLLPANDCDALWPIALFPVDSFFERARLPDVFPQSFSTADAA